MLRLRAGRAGSSAVKHRTREHCRIEQLEERLQLAVASVPYRWQAFDTYDTAAMGWMMGNDAALYGGVAPSSWSNGGATAASMSRDPLVLASLFTNKGYAGSNAMIWSEDSLHLTTNGGRVVSAMFRVHNATSAPLTWNPHFYFSSNWAWGEKASVAVDGTNVWLGSGFGAASTAIQIAPNTTSTVIFVSTSGPGAFAGGSSLERGTQLGFYNDSLSLPAGLSFVDDLASYSAPYRWQVFNTYDNAATWMMGNNAGLFGGVAPSAWTESYGIPQVMSTDPSVLASLFTNKGYGAKNAMIWSEESPQLSSTNGKIVTALFRVRNTTGSAINWSPSFYYSSNPYWGETASVAVNGNILWAGYGLGSTSVNVTLPANATSSVVFVSTGGPAVPTGGNNFERAVQLGFNNNSLALPAGLAFVDDLASTSAPYRWQAFNTFDNAGIGWMMGNNASMFGGVSPETWTDWGATAQLMSSDPNVLASLFTNKGYGAANAMIWSEDALHYSSSTGRIVTALFRVRNTTGGALTWTPNFYYSSNLGWGERASVAVNGTNVWVGTGYGSASTTITLPANMTSTVIFVSTSGPGAYGSYNVYERGAQLGFYNNSLTLPAGLSFVDDLTPEGVPPTVTGVYANGGLVSPNQQVVEAISSLTVALSADMATTGAGSVLDPSNWKLTHNGVDISPQISSVSFSYNLSTGRYEAQVNLSAARVGGQIALFAKDTMTSVSGVALDGNTDGAAGGDYAISFTTNPPVATGAEFMVNASTAGDQAFAVETRRNMAVDAYGNYVIVWAGAGTGGSGSDIYFQRFDAAGVKIGPETIANANLSGDQVQPSVAMTPNGDFVIAWTQAAGSVGAAIFARAFYMSGSPLTPDVRVDTQTSANQQAPVVAMDSSHFVVAWQSYGLDGSGWGVYARHFTTAGYYAPAGQFRINSTWGGDQASPAAAMDYSGNLLVSWTTWAGDGGTDIYAQRFNAASTPTGKEFRVNSTTTDNQAYPAVAVGPMGAAVVTWASPDGSGWGISAQRYDRQGVAQGAEFLVNGNSTLGDQTYPSAAIDSQGNYVVAWASQGQDGSGWGIYARRYDNQGRALDGSFRANSWTDSDQVLPQVAIRNNQNFLIAWQSAGQDGSGQGVYAQRFAPNVPPVNITLTAGSVNENQPAGTLVGTLGAQDYNAGSTFTYSLVSGAGSTDNSLFTIVGDSLRTAAYFNFEAKSSHAIRVRATDGGGLWYEKALTIAVNDVDETPTDIALSGTSVAENQPSGTVIGTFTTTDGAIGNTFTYTLVIGLGSYDNANFAINGNTLETAAGLDYEARDAHRIRVRTTNQDGVWFEKQFLITVTDASEAPSDITLTATRVAETEAIGTTVGQFFAIDADRSIDFAYALVGGEGSTGNASFAIDGNSLKTAAVFDYETQNSYSIRVRATDVDGLTFEKVFTISVSRVSLPVLSFAPSVQYAAGMYATSVTQADLNGDGKADMVVAGTLGSVGVLLGNGNGTFMARRDFAVGSNPLEVAVGDVNGDGKPDLVAANSESNSLSVLLGNGDGTFQAKRDVSLGGSPNSVAAVDVNGDGKLDLVTANRTGNNVSLLLGVGDGTFGTEQTLSVGSGPAVIRAADFNADGKTDVVTANTSSNGVSVLLGNGDGTFQARQDSGANSPSSLATGDFNADGVLDLATASDSARSVSVMLGNGDGTFQWYQNAYLGTMPFGIATGDFDGNGKLDLAAASYSSNNVSVLRGKGDGTFHAKLDLAVGSMPYEIVAGDFNADGKTDLATANFAVSNSLSVLLNTTVSTAPTGIGLSANAVAENQPANATVAVLSTTDPDVGDAFTYLLVGGAGSEDNASFTIVDDQLQTVGTFNYEVKNSYSVRIRTTDAAGLFTESAFTIAVADVDEVAPTVSSVTINSGEVQRSMITKITVVFSEPVYIDENGLTVVRTSGAQIVDVTVNAIDPLGDRTTWELSFTGAGSIGASLPDGLYDFIASAAAIRDTAGNSLAANYTRRFHRLFGDSDGDRDVDNADLRSFRLAMSRPAGDRTYWYFDYNGNDVVNGQDYIAFKSRLMRTVVR